MILVVGSTGVLGTEICRRLLARHERVRGLVRPSADPKKVETLRRLGVEVATGDLRDPTSLTDASRGVDVVISTVSSMASSYQAGTNDIQSVDFRGELDLIAAAKANAVRHVVYTSFSGNIEGNFPLCRAKRTVERALQASGLRYTILRPSYFTEVWLSPAVGFNAAQATAQIYGTGDQRISWISFRDVAAFAVASLAAAAAQNATLELGGREALSPHAVIGRFEAAGQRRFTLAHVSRDVLTSQFHAATDSMQQSFLGLMLCYANGDVITGMDELSRKFSVELTSLDEYIGSLLPAATRMQATH